VAVDFVCTHPAGLAQHPLVVDNAKRHCNRAETRKVQADGPPCEEKGWGFSTFALSTWGGLGTSAKAVLFEVTKRATADLRGWPQTQALLQIREGLSVTLMRAIARQLTVKGQVGGPQPLVGASSHRHRDTTPTSSITPDTHQPTPAKPTTQMRRAIRTKSLNTPTPPSQKIPTPGKGYPPWAEVRGETGSGAGITRDP
jgi:hypothetical protein